MSVIKGMNRNAIVIVAGIVAISLLAAASDAEAAKKKRGPSGTLTVKTGGLPAGTPVRITVSGGRNKARKIRKAGSRTFRRLPLGRYVIRSSATRIGSKQVVAQKGASAVRLTRKSPRRTLKVRYRQPLRFKIKDAQGLGIRSSGSFARSQGRSGVSARSDGGSNLTALQNGRLVDAVGSSEGDVKVDYLLVRGDAAYVVFQKPINLVTGEGPEEIPEGSSTCIFAKIEKSTEKISCVDSALSKVGGQLSWVGWLAPPPVQFGADGSIYYSGQIGPESRPALRRKAPSGEITTVLTRSGLDSFVLLPSRKVAVRTCPGGNCSKQEHFVWTPGERGGTFEPTPNLGVIWYMVRFADNKLYFGTSNPSPPNPPVQGAWFLGIRRYDPKTALLDIRSWLVSWNYPRSGNSLFNSHVNLDRWCIGSPENGWEELSRRMPLCAAGGFQASSHIRSGSRDYLLIRTPANWEQQSMIIEADSSNPSAPPSMRPIEYRDIDSVNFMVALGNQMVASGVNRNNGKYVIARKGLGDDNQSNERVLFEAGLGFVVLGLDADPSRNEVIFYGVDPSASRFVLGRVNLDGEIVSETQPDDPSFSLLPQSFQSFD